MKHLISSRRRVIQSFTSLTLYFGLGSAAIFYKSQISCSSNTYTRRGSKTPAQLEGPFFTTNSPERSNLANANGRAQKIKVFDEVLDQFCQPVSGAMLDFWQSDERGVYDNRSDRLRGHQFSNMKGKFSLFVPNAGCVHRSCTPPARKSAT